MPFTEYKQRVFSELVRRNGYSKSLEIVLQLNPCYSLMYAKGWGISLACQVMECFSGQLRTQAI